ncbi:MAG: hypothetical protein ABI345_05815 [Jatrophihabitans sp.]
MYALLPLLFGTRENGTVRDCTEHVSYGRSTSTSYQCGVQLTTGSTTTVSFDSSPSFGDHVSLTMWGGRAVDVGQATRQSWIFGGIGLISIAGGVWFLQHTRVRTQDNGADVPSR